MAGNNGRAGGGWTAAAAAASLLLVLAAGCQTVEPEEQPAPRPTFDECAGRLQRIESHLLVYYSRHHVLPETLGELRGMRGMDELPNPVCPVSGQPYLYLPEGAGLAGTSGQVLLCDATAVHSGRRWGIVVRTAPGRGTFILDVVALPPGWQPAGGKGEKESDDGSGSNG